MDNKSAEYIMWASFWGFMALAMTAFIFDDINDSWSDKICIEAEARKYPLKTCLIYENKNIEAMKEVP
jgi:hypothetical protein